jgi:archaeosine synthase alpha-subunit
LQWCLLANVISDIKHNLLIHFQWEIIRRLISFQEITMQFQCSNTDGPAQTGLLSINNHKMKIPSILFPRNGRYHPPTYSEGYITTSDNQTKNNIEPLISVGNSIFFKQESAKEKNNIQNFLIIPEALPTPVQECLQQYDEQRMDQIITLPSDEQLVNKYISSDVSQLLIVSNAAQLFSNPKKFISYITSIRKLCNYDSLLYLPAIAHPSTLAILCYSGADLFDATRAILDSRHLQFYLPDTTTCHVNEISENPCNCPVCSQTEKLPSTFSFTQLIEHNYLMLWQELLIIRHAIRQNHLRDLVEKRIRHSPHFITLLRYLDSIGFDHLEERTPVSMPESYTLQTTSREAGFRPEIKRFQDRILNRYQKPIGKKILLLLPCSAKKPYSFSKSHQRFFKAISKASNPSIIHEVIITSPLGLVPRELELTYPASSYDISVTGTWYEDEKKMIQDQMEQFLMKNHYDAIVCHLPETLIHPPNEVKSIWHISLTDGKSTEKNSLKKLSEILSELTVAKDYDAISKAEQKRIQIQAVATYQFGPTLANELTTDSIVKGKYPYLKFFDEQGRQLGMIPDKRGLISLTAEGGKRISKYKNYSVSIDSGFTVKGSILAPGVNVADKVIRKGDDVIVFQGDSYLGVGSATMNGVEMTKRTYGEAVNMRHKIKE